MKKALEILRKAVAYIIMGAIVFFVLLISGKH